MKNQLFNNAEYFRNHPKEAQKFAIHVGELVDKDVTTIIKRDKREKQGQLTISTEKRRKMEYSLAE